ncbi:MAG: general secretion pathway protein GspB [Rhodoferax sp.]
MSYILDALKRADAERGRGAVPGLHTRQLPSPSEGSPAAPSARSALWMGLAAALALAGVAGGLWLWQQPSQAPGALIVQAVTLEPQASLALAPVATVTPVVSAPIKAEPEPTSAAPVVATPVPVPAPPKGKPAALVAPANAAPAALPLLSDLPDELRGQVPSITITGAVYAKNPAQRLLLVNNLVLAQGALIAPELTLEEIQARSSVFSFRGTRFRVTH